MNTPSKNPPRVAKKPAALEEPPAVLDRVERSRDVARLRDDRAGERPEVHHRAAVDVADLVGELRRSRTSTLTLGMSWTNSSGVSWPSRKPISIIGAWSIDAVTQ
jgi:hypothetical protein